MRVCACQSSALDSGSYQFHPLLAVNASQVDRLLHQIENAQDSIVDAMAPQRTPEAFVAQTDAAPGEEVGRRSREASLDTPETCNIDY